MKRCAIVFFSVSIILGIIGIVLSELGFEGLLFYLGSGVSLLEVVVSMLSKEQRCVHLVVSFLLSLLVIATYLCGFILINRIVGMLLLIFILYLVIKYKNYSEKI